MELTYEEIEALGWQPMKWQGTQNDFGWSFGSNWKMWPILFAGNDKNNPDFVGLNIQQEMPVFNTAQTMQYFKMNKEDLITLMRLLRIK